MDVPTPYIVNDVRKNEDFRKKTFSGYSKKEVFDIFFKSLDENKLEDSCQWCVEIIISGYYEELWERIIAYISKFIGIHNPLLPYTLFLRIIKFLKLKKIEIFQKNYLELRNSQEIRNMFCEIVCIIIFSTKSRKCRNLVKIKELDFSETVFKRRLIAKNLEGSEKFYKSEDPKELSIIMNEFFFNIGQVRYNLDNLIYWLSWCFEWEKVNIKSKKKFVSNIRDITGIDKKYTNDFIWIFWEIILYETKQRYNNELNKQISSLYEFFKIKYSSSKKRKRVYLIFNCLELLDPKININDEFIEKNPVIDRYHMLVQACGNINVLYKDKKINENLTSELVNSKLKQEATFVVTKYQDLSLTKDFPDKQKPKYLRERDNPKNLLSNKKKTEDKTQKKLNMVSQIDSILTSQRRFSKSKNIKSNINTSDFDKNIQKLEKPKTINLINEIERKFNNKKSKDNIVTVKKKIINL